MMFRLPTLNSLLPGLYKVKYHATVFVIIIARHFYVSRFQLTASDAYYANHCKQSGPFNESSIPVAIRIVGIPEIAKAPPVHSTCRIHWVETTSISSSSNSGSKTRPAVMVGEIIHISNCHQREDHCITLPHRAFYPIHFQVPVLSVGNPV